MKANGARRTLVEVSEPVGHRRIAGGSRFCRSARMLGNANDVDTGSQQLATEQFRRRSPPMPQKSPYQQQPQRRGLSHGHQEQGPLLHVVAKPKLMPRFTRIQVLRIIKLATMDKLRDSGASGPDDLTRQRLATEGPTGAGEGGASAGGKGEGGSDEYHHQFYNTGRIGRRNALPDILGTHCTTSTADLSTQLGGLSTSECPGKPSDGSGVLTSSMAPPDSRQTPTTTGT